MNNTKSDQVSDLKRPKSIRSLAYIYVPWLSISLAIIVIDQLSKIYISNNLYYGQRINILSFFDLTLLFNTGAAFSFLADMGGTQRWIFTAIAIFAVILILYWLYKHQQQRLFCASLSLILAGAIGNLIDRILFGHVVDFLLFYWRDWYFPAFNIADISITCGAVLLILDEFLRNKKSRKSG